MQRPTAAVTLQDSGAQRSPDESLGDVRVGGVEFTNGKVYTVNEKQPWAEAVAVNGNKIVYVGDAKAAQALVGRGTEQIDLAGKTVMPGFISAHDHLVASNWTTAGVNLFDVKSKEECLQRIKEYAEAHRDDKVVKGIGWNLENLGGEYPTAKDLDTAVPNRPACRA